MLIIPAIDIRGGRCVRLVHGDPNNETVYSADPIEVARGWHAKGAKRIHLVDLDAALGLGSNLDVIFDIKSSVPCEIQMGGGLRSLEILSRVMEKGIDRAIIGTALFKEPAWVAEALRKYKGRLLAGVDARHGEVKLEGWKEGSGLALPEALRRVEGMGFQELIFTDISKDGTLSGPNVEATRAVMKSSRMAVYASGGVSCLDDIKALKALEPEGLIGCIVGKALYDGRLSFAEALQVC
ncbi:MAG: 1-(5-phosphoribosyl)-5-[(5-phosphoribosylamino)methylideneamino]imidazole-4-carboxamide isomerase [Elusimicrobia bacterium]|nr:1-(5-phosphoribosyl)-5-[(5-phosphoribosylamino)methylideneamino]imidazole-4-carboxamide isomerase [Elusimicrobiota bacterium]